MAREQSAVTPTAEDGRQYHLYTRPGDLSPLCLFPGSRERVEMIMNEYLEEPDIKGDHRGHLSVTGRYKGVLISAVNTNIGGPEVGITLPEAYASGARVFIRPGSSSALRREIEIGDVVIVILSSII